MIVHYNIVVGKYLLNNYLNNLHKFIYLIKFDWYFSSSKRKIKVIFSVPLLCFADALEHHSATIKVMLEKRKK